MQQQRQGRDIETAICARLQDEGVGSVYERVVLSRWFREMAARHGYRSAMEYSCPITKGYDTITLLDEGLHVTVADEQVERIEQGWRFPQRPAFSRLRDARPADLVWNFACVQMQPQLVDEMRALARKHVLVLVPNALNPGAPFHMAYHLLTRTPCRHAERGSVRIRTRRGLLDLMARRGITVIESGYIDVPPIPDIAFSIRELKETMGWAKPASPEEAAVAAPPSDPEGLWRKVQQMTHFENSRLIAPLKGFFGHHIYALGRVA